MVPIDNNLLLDESNKIIKESIKIFDILEKYNAHNIGKIENNKNLVELLNCLKILHLKYTEHLKEIYNQLQSELETLSNNQKKRSYKQLVSSFNILLLNRELTDLMDTLKRTHYQNVEHTILNLHNYLPQNDHTIAALYKNEALVFSNEKKANEFIENAIDLLTKIINNELLKYNEELEFINRNFKMVSISQFELSSFTVNKQAFQSLIIDFKQTRIQRKKGDGFMDSVLNTLNNDWGRYDTSYHVTKFKIEKKTFINSLNSLLNELQNHINNFYQVLDTKLYIQHEKTNFHIDMMNLSLKCDLVMSNIQDIVYCQRVNQKLLRRISNITKISQLNKKPHA